MTWHRVVKYEISAVPEDLCKDAYAWSIAVEWRDKELWAVTRFSQCLGSDGKWDYESSPSNRTDEWKKTHRFTESEALRLAHEIAPTISVNGILPADLIDKYSS